MPPRIRRTNKTILVTVEGYTEEVLLRHLKSLYCLRTLPISVTIKNARGHGPQGVIDAIKAACKTAEYSAKIAVFDGDIPLTPEDSKWFSDENVTLFISTPCIEATLLKMRSARVASNTASCKRSLERLLPGDQTDLKYYERHFPREVIESARVTLPMINDLIIYITTAP